MTAIARLLIQMYKGDRDAVIALASFPGWLNVHTVAFPSFLLKTTKRDGAYQTLSIPVSTYWRYGAFTPSTRKFQCD